MSQAPDISLPRFEGPLDLLLSLVRKSEIDLADIPIAEITRQYLDYLHKADELDMDLGADFVYMAALLIQVKTRCLLPRDPEIAVREPDPRQELVRQLLDHQQVRQAAEFLQQKLELAAATWSKSSIEEFQPAFAEEPPESGEALNLLQILRLAQRALEAARNYPLLSSADSVTVEEMIAWLEAHVPAPPFRLEAGRLLALQPDPPHRAALFLAMLEMAKSARISLEQERCFGPIYLVSVSRAGRYGTIVP